MALVFDIETYTWARSEDHKAVLVDEMRDKRLKDKVKARKSAEKKMALSPRSGQVIVIGLLDTDAVPDEQVKILKVGDDDPLDIKVVAYESESRLIEAFFEYIELMFKAGDRLVSFNGKEFDMPFLFTRALVHDLDGIDSYDLLIHKYNHASHLDIRSFLPKGKLTELSYLINELESPEYEDVGEMWERDQKLVVQHCWDDLVKTAALYERIKKWIPQKMSSYSIKKVPSGLLEKIPFGD